MKPFDDIRVRRAVALALHRKGFLETLAKQFVAPVYSPVPTDFLPGGLNQGQIESLGLMYSQNIAEARRLLTEAGYPDGFALQLVSSEKRLYRSCYEEMSRQLAKIGIDCHTQVVSHSTMHARIRNDPLPLILYVAWRPNADRFLSRFFHSDAIILSGEKPDTNFSHYSQVDRLIEEARLEIDPKKQIQLWEQAQIRILNDMVALPIMSVKQCYVRSNEVHYGHPLISTMALYPQFTEKTIVVEDRTDSNR
jgi:peptide/nickel transport system substrate-binding protein